MNPIAFELGSLAIRWYGLMMALGLAFGLWITPRLAPRHGIAAALVERHAVPFVIAVFAGARVAYALAHAETFVANPLEIVRLDHGGIGSHGAIAAGLVYFAWMQRRHGVSMWTLADVASIWIVVVNVLVRFGNFMNGELYGDPTSLPWGVVFSGAGDGPRHPLQIYEILSSLALLAFVPRWLRSPAFPGQVFWRTMIAMSAVRIGLDALRGHERTFGPLAAGQLAALALLAAGVWFLARRPAARA
jgi:phosphatidylglycerol:prolipoprotein diacylglycerol transferase